VIFRTYGAEKEQDNSNKASNTTNNRTPEDPFGCINACILGLFGHVTRSVKADEDPSCCKIGQTPIPSCRCSSSVISCHECFVCGSETPSVGSSDWEPDDVEEEIEKDEGRGEIENVSKKPCWG
jgi:hypothetical protein